MSRLTRVLNVLRRRAIDREFEEELRFHIFQRIQRSIREGMKQAMTTVCPCAQRSS